MALFRDVHWNFGDMARADDRRHDIHEEKAKEEAEGAR
jgi:hypothetical protein